MKKPLLIDDDDDDVVVAVSFWNGVIKFFVFISFSLCVPLTTFIIGLAIGIGNDTCGSSHGEDTCDSLVSTLVTAVTSMILIGDVAVVLTIGTVWTSCILDWALPSSIGHNINGESDSSLGNGDDDDIFDSTGDSPLL